MSVTMEQLQRVVLKLSNQAPVRYYLHLPSKSDTGQRFAVDVYEVKKGLPVKLNDELVAIGFEKGQFDGYEQGFCVYRWEAEREAS